jgi:hypothetical protein
MFGAGAMTKHERSCKMNPANAHKCFEFCKWLTKSYDDNGFTMFGCDNPDCPLTNSNLYSYKLERSVSGRPSIANNGLVRMPLECNHYEEDPPFTEF